MSESTKALEEKMTPEERAVFERYKQWIGKEFVAEEAVPDQAEYLEYDSYLTGYDGNVTWPGIKRWCVANEDFNGLWFDEEYARKSDFGGITAPPLYLLAIDDAMKPSSWLALEVYDMNTGTINTKKYPNFVGGLQANTEWEFFEAVRPGDRIEVRAKCTDVFWKQGKQFRLLFTFGETDYINQKGQTLARCRAGAVYRFK